jgi:hypothetical protein
MGRPAGGKPREKSQNTVDKGVKTAIIINIGDFLGKNRPKHTQEEFITMKKITAVLLVLVCVSAALSAQDFGLSAGGGGLFNANFTSLVLTDDGKNNKASDKNSYQVGGGFYAFFDATYAEATVGMLFGNFNSDGSNSKGINTTALTLGVYGKYPIGIAGFSLFPMLGIEGQINVAASYDGKAAEGKYLEEFNKQFSFFWFKAGVGADIPIATNLFLRGEALYGIRLNTENERNTINGVSKDKLDEFGDLIGTTSYKAYSAIVGHGLDIRLAIGYRFF